MVDGRAFLQTRYHSQFFRKCTFCTLIFVHACNRVRLTGLKEPTRPLCVCVCVCVRARACVRVCVVLCVMVMLPTLFFLADEHILEGSFLK